MTDESKETQPTERPSPRLRPSPTGGFKTIKRNADHYEVYYKHYSSGIMITLAYGLSKDEAQQLTGELSNSFQTFFANIRGESDDG